MKTVPYSSPPGTYDQPFTWAFDASVLANGSNSLGNSIYLIGGLGDFELRRVVGLNRILASDGTGKFRISRNSKNIYMSSAPIQAPNSPELPIAPGVLYPENGSLYFDLYGLSAFGNLTGQLAFQGVRRKRGTGPQNPTYKAYSKTFTYQLNGFLTQVASAANPVVASTPILDYDFELHQIILLSAPQPFVEVGDPDIGFMEFSQVGNTGATILIRLNTSGIPNQPTTVVVTGSTITFTGPTDNVGTPTTGPVNDAFAIQLNAMPQVAALVVAASNGGHFDFAPSDVFPANLLLPGFTPTDFTFGPPPPLEFLPITTPVCSMTLYDYVKVKCSNIPILDIYYNGGPGSPYQNGALIPPMWYPKQSSIKVDFLSQITSLGSLPATVQVLLVGKQWIPC